MLKKSSRPVSTKQGLMADPFSLPSPTQNYNKPPAPSPLFPLSPRAFVGFSLMGYSDIDAAAAMSPTSILETKLFTPTANPFEKNPRKPVAEPAHESMQPRQPVGLGIVGALKKPAKPESRMVLFGSQLKIQIPSFSPNALVEPLNSPIEFGVKNKESQLATLSPLAAAAAAPRRRAPVEAAVSLVSGRLSASEMEMSEEYTCVIAHGPNPRTTHIFDNWVVESCGWDGFVAVTPRNESRVSDDFLATCCACKRRLGQGKDIFMYRFDFSISLTLYYYFHFPPKVCDCDDSPFNLIYQ